jgi:hypothetical protein
MLSPFDMGLHYLTFMGRILYNKKNLDANINIVNNVGIVNE